MLTDRDALNAVDVGLTIAVTMQRLYGTNFAADKMQVLLRVYRCWRASGRQAGGGAEGWLGGGLEAYRKRREPFLPYR